MVVIGKTGGLGCGCHCVTDGELADVFVEGIHSLSGSNYLVD